MPEILKELKPLVQLSNKLAAKLRFSTLDPRSSSIQEPEQLIHFRLIGDAQ